MQVCESPRWAFPDSCRSEMRLELAGVGGGGPGGATPLWAALRTPGNWMS